MKRGICLILALVLMLGLLPGVAGAQEVFGDLTVDAVQAETLTYLYGIDLIVGSTKGEWAVLAMARAGLLEGTEEKALAYEQKALTALAEGKLKRPTDYARVVLALTSLGKEAPDAAVEHCQDFDSAVDQGLNAVTYCLIALDTKPYAPENTAIREQYLTYLLAHSCPGGGWVYGDVAGAEADADMTAMVLQALAPYRDRPEVSTAIGEALVVLAAMQEQTGAFGTYGLVNAESTAQVIVALTCLGLDPTGWNGHDAVQALLNFYDRDSGMFLHQLGGIPDQMATEQSAYALVAYTRQKNGQSTLYDMQELFPTGGEIDAQEQVTSAAQAIENLGHQTVTMAQIQTREQALAYVRERIAQLGITAPDWTAEVEQFTPATAGTEEAPEGTAGSFSVQVTVSMEGATDAVVSVSGTITPEVYTPSGGAEAVDALIAGIGTVCYTPECKDKITAARKAFDELSKQEQEKVTGLDTLLEAEETYARLEAAAQAETAVSNAANAVEALGTQTVSMNTVNTETAALSYVRTRLRLLNLTGIIWDVRLTGFTAAVAGTQATPEGTQGSFGATVTLSASGGASRELQLSGVIVPAKYTASQGNIAVTVTLLGDSIHAQADQPHGLARGGLTTWISAASVSLPSGATVLDALTQAFERYGVSMTNPGGNYISAITYDGKTLGEFTNGKNSGWMYTLNGVHPNVGVAAQGLEDGDVIVFHYTDDYTYEEGGVNFRTGVTSGSTAPASEEQSGEIGDVYAQTGDYLESLGVPTVGSVGGEWMVLGLARSGREVPGRETYLQAVVDYVRENIDDGQRLHRAKSTDNARLILALTALGEDVTNVDGHDLLQGLQDLEYVTKQGNNGPIWALLALDSGNYPTAGGTATRQALIQQILCVQTVDGGWTLSGDQADSDLTGMALQALAPYYLTNPQVTEAVDRGLECLSRMQDEDGGFSTLSGSEKIATSESVAQVIVALTALGIDPDADARFVKNGRSVMDALLAYFVPGGGFRHILDGELDGMATEQAYYALTAYNRLLEGKTGLYDMTDVIDRGGDPEAEPEAPTEPTLSAQKEPTSQTQLPWLQLLTVLVLGIGIGAGSVLTVVLVICVVRKKHGSFEKREDI